ncbi:MAG TPA: squalene/phytoene synthase family protein, partial [Pirellulales bacterium]
WANFCQDVARDWDKGRVYLPQATLRRHGVDDATFAARRATSEFRAALAEEVARADNFLRRGAPLVERLPPDLAIDVDLFVRGGLAILEAVRRVDYDVWTRRPEVSKGRKLWLLCQTCSQRLTRAFRRS